MAQKRLPNRLNLANIFLSHALLVVKIPKVEPLETDVLHFGIVSSLTYHNHSTNKVFRLIALEKNDDYSLNQC